MVIISGIYRIVCVANGNYYYGSSKNISRRWCTHKSRLRRGTHANHKLQNTWNKYQEHAFRVEITEIAPVDQLSFIENKYLQKYYGTPHCMNLSMDSVAFTRNIKRSPMLEETKEKIRSALLGHTVSPESRQKMGDANRGKLRGPRTYMDKRAISISKRPDGFPAVKSPDGQIYTIEILEVFCKEHGLHAPSMSAVINKKQKTYRKWCLL